MEIAELSPDGVRAAADELAALLIDAHASKRPDGTLAGSALYYRLLE